MIILVQFSFTVITVMNILKLIKIVYALLFVIILIHNKFQTTHVIKHFLGMTPTLRLWFLVNLVTIVKTTITSSEL